MLIFIYHIFNDLFALCICIQSQLPRDYVGVRKETPDLR